ncbi:MAG: DUF805 domain-containing protein [Candidatus Thiodiazotropha sp. (ex Lucina pensylvanica)]|nr:DUF805 domain-containing protein [Candidatus Thiodiazotropha sp. (ex Lucina pensylvanica)]MBT3052722.1 DUF805 domain-containing protein [Candidatus Thiodiazotropha sp. (ex Codakia orbicularis)]
MESWQYLNPEGRLKRRPYFYRFIALSLLAILGGYLIREILVSDKEISPYYLEISFVWSIIVITLLTPLAIQRCRDIGISVWWVIILWLSPFSSLKFYIIVSEYTGLNISGTALMVSSFVALIVVIFVVMLFFSRSTLNASNQSSP